MSYLVIKYKTIDGYKSLDHYDASNDLEILLDRHKLYLASEGRIGFDVVHYNNISGGGLYLIELGSVTDEGYGSLSREHKDSIGSLMKSVLRDNKLGELGIED